MLIAANLFNKSAPFSLILCCYALTVLLSGLFGSLIAENFSEPVNKFLRRSSIKNSMNNPSGVSTQLTEISK
jgi:hypothetical protein